MHDLEVVSACLAPSHTEAEIDGFDNIAYFDPFVEVLNLLRTELLCEQKMPQQQKKKVDR
jgi:hypothetical protein